MGHKYLGGACRCPAGDLKVVPVRVRRTVLSSCGAAVESTSVAGTEGDRKWRSVLLCSWFSHGAVCPSPVTPVSGQLCRVGVCVWVRDAGERRKCTIWSC